MLKLEAVDSAAAIPENLAAGHEDVTGAGSLGDSRAPNEEHIFRWV